MYLASILPLHLPHFTSMRAPNLIFSRFFFRHWFIFAHCRSQHLMLRFFVCHDCVTNWKRFYCVAWNFGVFGCIFFSRLLALFSQMKAVLVIIAKENLSLRLFTVILSIFAKRFHLTSITTCLLVCLCFCFIFFFLFLVSVDCEFIPSILWYKVIILNLVQQMSGSTIQKNCVVNFFFSFCISII